MVLRYALCTLLAVVSAIDEEEEGEEVLHEEEVSVNLASKLPTRRTYLLEVVIGLCLFAYALNFYLGRKKNETIAVNWMQSLRPIFEENFSHVGVNDKGEAHPLLQKDAHHAYKFFATGRYNCAYALASLELVKRQDLLSTTVLGIIWPEQDRMLVEIPIKPLQPQPLVFAVTKSQLLKKIRNSVEDIKNFAKLWKSDDLHSNLRVLGENDEVASGLLDAKAKGMLNAIASHVQLIHLTDIYSIKAAYPLTLQGEFILPAHNSEAISIMMKLMLHLTDLASNFRLSNGAKVVAEKERAVFNERKLKEQKEERVEELARKKAEKKKAEEEKKATLSKEKLRRLEEKEYKKSLKKSGPRMKVVKG